MAPFAKEVIRAATLIVDRGGAVALTGAGVSTESGIPDFRSQDGLWSRFDPMEYGTLGAFRRDPVKVWDMLAVLLDVIAAEPNDGHRAMAELERRGWLQGIITQNIDGLHQKAGSRNVVEFHGSLSTFSCPACTRNFSQALVLGEQLPPRCLCGKILKPDIVFFDEPIPVQALRRTEKLLTGTGVLLVAGTSCQVAPAASIPCRWKETGGAIIEINLEPALTGLADICLAGSFARVMCLLAARLPQRGFIHG